MNLPAVNLGTKSEAGRGVMVTGEYDDLAVLDQASECVAEERDRLNRRDRPVEDVSGDQDRIDGLGFGQGDYLIDEDALRVDQVDTMQGSSKVPVAGMKEPHASKVGRRTDSSTRTRRRLGP